MDTADSLPPPALDKVGGIVAAIVFGLCFLALTWQWLRHKFHPFAVISLFLLLRTIGWLVASIGAIQGDSGLNKRGYILNAILFWLMALGAMLLLVRWNVCRRGKSWNKLAWSAVGLVTIPCLVLGALDVAGQIYWLDNPSGDPPTTLKVASVGFLVLTGAYGLASLAFAFREQFVYQRPLVRLSFVLSGLFLILRCICWMVVSLNISRFSGKNRLIFLYCTATIFEMLVAIVWSTTPLATNLKLPKHDNLPDLPSLKVVDDSVAHPSRTQGSSAPTNNEPSRPSNLNAVFERDEDDSEGEEHELEQVAAVPATTQYVVNPVGHNSYNMPTANPRAVLGYRALTTTALGSLAPTK
ncbi:hypothetical protein GGI02_002470 [Coemansia sp. RSA 2322]|nr:hypothetical protein GGI02_002470 [Coemansia sp. RSA 2322]